MGIKHYFLSGYVEELIELRHSIEKELASK